MPWVKLDDHFPEHPKIAAVGPLGIALWAAGLAYCNRALTDGYIPRGVARTLLDWTCTIDDDEWTISITRGMTGEDIDADMVLGLLVEHNLFYETRGGYRIHDYLEFQPSKEKVLAERERERGKKRNQRKSPPESPGDTRGDTLGDDPGESDQIPAAPVPVPASEGDKGEEGSSNGSSAVRPQRATPDFTTALELDPEKELALLKFRSLRFSDDKTVDVVRHTYGHLPVAAFHRALEAAGEHGNVIEYAMGALRSMVAEGQYAAKGAA